MVSMTAVTILESHDAENSKKFSKEIIKSAFQDIVSDELKKIKDPPFSDCVNTTGSSHDADSILWEYDGLHVVYQGEREGILLEMQKIFYEDLSAELNKRESSTCGTWEDEEDDYLAHAVYEQMKLNGDLECKEIWCPICKRGGLQQSHRVIYCGFCNLELNRGDEVNLELLRVRLGDAHEEHLDKGCRSPPKFCVKTLFDLTALYIHCQICGMFEVVL